MQATHQHRRISKYGWAIALLAALSLGAAEADAADITVLHGRTSEIPVVVLNGEMLQTDGQKFATAVAPLGRALIVMNSPGGSLIAGLQIGQIMRLRHLISYVPQEAICASACAFAWLGGSIRAMQPQSHIGFHAAYIKRGNEKQESGVGNALAGAYLNTLGLSMDAIVYIESSHPDEITWLTPSDARDLGIKVVIVPASAGNPKERVEPDSPAREPRQPQPRVAGPDNRPSRRDTGSPVVPPSILAPELSAPVEEDPTLIGSLEERARKFSQNYFAHWSEDNSQALAYFRTTYAPEVSFYGKQAERSDLLDGKKQYAERWPVRVYTTRPDSLRTFCNSDNDTCTVSGLVDWDCRNPARNTRSTGTANFTLTLTLRDNGNQIVAENGSVIARNVD